MWDRGGCWPMGSIASSCLRSQQVATRLLVQHLYPFIDSEYKWMFHKLVRCNDGPLSSCLGIKTVCGAPVVS